MNTETSRHAKFDYVILGGGPAGLQLAYFLERAGRDYIVLDRATRAGSFFEQHPRHRTLLSINKVHTGRDEPEFNMRHDWNSLLTHPDEPFLFKNYSREYFPQADALVSYLNDFRDRFALRTRFGFDVTRIHSEDRSTFVVEASDGRVVRGRRLIVATGMAKPHIPDIRGIEHAVGYEDMSTNPEDFAGKNVLILGKGNSAFETANHLMAHAAVIHLSSPEGFKFAWNSHFVGHLRSVNNAFIDSYLLKSQNAILDGDTLSIEKLPSGKLRVQWSAKNTEIDEEIEQLEYDCIIRCTGFRFDDGVFDASCRPALRACGRLPLMTGAWESASVPDMFFAGTLMQTLDYKQSQSSFIHGFRHNVKTLFHILEDRYEATPLPAQALSLEPSALAHDLLERANGSCELWQQVGFLTDVIELPSGAQGEARWFKGLSRQFVEEHWGSRPEAEYYTLMMTYGPCSGEETVFQHVHGHNPMGDLVYGDLTIEIHPMIRRFRGSTLLAEYHVRSDFMTDWSSNFFRTPLADFFARDLNGERPSETQRPSRRVLVRNAEMRFADVIIDGVSADRAS